MRKWHSSGTGWLVVLGIAAAVAACGGDDDDGGGGGTTTGSGAMGAGGGVGATGGGVGATGGTGGALPFELTSSAFTEGQTIPLPYECGPPLVADGPGDNVSPPLSWTPGPAGTLSYALVMRDLDAGNLVHWVVYDIPTTASGLEEDIPSGYELTDPAGAKQAELQGVYYGYLGPCSGPNTNTYQWTLHALDVPAVPGVDMDTTENDIAGAIEGMSTATATLSGES